MRSIILVLIVAIVVIIAGVATGYISINQTREAKAPAIATTPNGITAKGGQAPAFDVETGSVKVGTKETTVKVPALTVQPARKQAATSNNSQ